MSNSRPPINSKPRADFTQRFDSTQRSDFTHRIRGWPTFLPKPTASARLKATPADFQVIENIGFELEHDGDHLCLLIEKTNLNTATVIDILTRVFKVKAVDVGYFGLKDKRAVTRQWFSIHLPGKTPEQLARGTGAIEEQLLCELHLFSTRSKNANPADENHPTGQHPAQLTVLSLDRHGRKFRPGNHRANRFKLRLTGCRGDRTAIEQSLLHLETRGFPNYFGPQRFGFNGNNLDAATRLLRQSAGSRGRKTSRTRRSMLLSAARSFLFNEVLAARLQLGDWLTLQPGEILMLAGSKSVFTVSDSDCIDDESLAALQRRLESQDVQLTGPLWGQPDGRGEREEPAARVEIEQRIMAENSALADGLIAYGANYQRRALRAAVSEFSYRWEDSADLHLEFELQPGVYATSALREIVDVGN